MCVWHDLKLKYCLYKHVPNFFVLLQISNLYEVENLKKSDSLCPYGGAQWIGDWYTVDQLGAYWIKCKLGTVLEQNMIYWCKKT